MTSFTKIRVKRSVVKRSVTVLSAHILEHAVFVQYIAIMILHFCTCYSFTAQNIAQNIQKLQRDFALYVSNVTEFQAPRFCKDYRPAERRSDAERTDGRTDGRMCCTKQQM